MNRILYFIIFQLLILVGCRAVYHVQDASYEDYRLQVETGEEDKNMEAIIAPYRVQMSEQMDEVLIVATNDLVLGSPESTMGNFAADATEIMAEWYTDEEVHFAIHNYSGIRIKNIGKGDITLGRIYEMMPFDNYLVTVELSGDEVEMLCDFMASKGGWPSSASLTYVIEDGLAEQVQIDGKTIRSESKYVLATNNYIIESANYQDYLATKQMTNTNVYVRDAIADYLRSLQEAGSKLNPARDKRVTKN